MKPSVAIIGAGLSGMALAHYLKTCADISVFEKSRGVGGRMSTRRQDDFEFDHGAQFFTARTQAFKNFIQPLIHQGLIQEWLPKMVLIGKDQTITPWHWSEPHFVPSAGMNALCKWLQTDVNVFLNKRIAELKKKKSEWFLQDHEDQLHGPFDWIISTIPAPQASQLIPQDFKYYDNISNTQMNPCYSLMLGFDEALNLNWDCAKIADSPIEWIAKNDSKPGRRKKTTLVIQTTNEWAQTHLEFPQDHIQQRLLQEVKKLINIDQVCDLEKASYVSLHRWRYANTQRSTDQSIVSECYLDHQIQISVCGDWCLEGRVESAYLSAWSLVSKLKEYLK